jgi:hypothetical protein
VDAKPGTTEPALLTAPELRVVWWAAHVIFACGTWGLTWFVSRTLALSWWLVLGVGSVFQLLAIVCAAFVIGAERDLREGRVLESRK